MKFKCTNKQCEKFNEEIQIQKVRWKYNQISKKMDDHNINCEICKENMQFIEEKKEGNIDIYFAKFRASSPEQRKEIVKKRAQQHNLTKMKDRIPEVRKKLLGL